MRGDASVLCVDGRCREDGRGCEVLDDLISTDDPVLSLVDFTSRTASADAPPTHAPNTHKERAQPDALEPHR